jgi:hypothetical protein
MSPFQAHEWSSWRSRPHDALRQNPRAAPARPPATFQERGVAPEPPEGFDAPAGANISKPVGVAPRSPYSHAPWT